MLTQQLIDTATRYPQRPALIYDEFNWTWAEIVQQVRYLAGGLKTVGIAPGDQVALWLNNSPAFVFAYFAVLARGAIVVPLNPSMKLGDFNLQTNHLKAVLTSNNLRTSCIRALGLDANKQLYYVDSEQGWNWKGLKLQDSEPIHCDADTIALLQYSSGSTGIPKPLYRTHAQCLAEIQHFCITCKITEQDRIFCAIPLFHAHGMGNALWAAVGSGATLVLMSRPQPFSLQAQRTLTLLENETITIFPGVPMLFETLIASPELANLNHLRLCFSAGNALEPDTYQRFKNKFGINIRQLYGCTEAGSISIDLAEPATEGSVGKPMHGINLEIRDERGQILPNGKIGEIAVNSSAVGCTAKSAKSDWFLSGDMGYLDDVGRLYISGRKDFVVLVAGHKVYTHEVEAVLNKCPRISEVVIVGVSDRHSGQALKAFVVQTDNLTEIDFFQYCRDQLPTFKRPQTVVFVKKLPKNTMGKVIKSQLNLL